MGIYDGFRGPGVDDPNDNVMIILGTLFNLGKCACRCTSALQCNSKEKDFLALYCRHEKIVERAFETIDQYICGIFREFS